MGNKRSYTQIKYPSKSKRFKQRNIKSGAYKTWQKCVFQRDKYKCQACGTKDTRFEAHHIKPVKYFPKETLNLDNGVTLCRDCHKEIHKIERSTYPLDILIDTGEDKIAS